MFRIKKTTTLKAAQAAELDRRFLLMGVPGGTMRPTYKSFKHHGIDTPIVYAVADDDTIIGWCMYVPPNTSENYITYYPNTIQVFVKPKYRRNKVGKSLINKIRKFIPSDFQVVGWNKSSMNFFTAIGIARINIQ